MTLVNLYRAGHFYKRELGLSSLSIQKKELWAI